MITLIITTVRLAVYERTQDVVCFWQKKDKIRNFFKMAMLVKLLNQVRVKVAMGLEADNFENYF